jgi:two-component system, response regulator RegA
MAEPQQRGVLLVEDDAVFASVLSRALQARGYATWHAPDTALALALMREQHPDAALVDLKLGRESGLDVIPVLLAECPGMRVVVLTGYASITTAVQAVKLGAAEYLLKPAEVADVVAALEGKPAIRPSGDVPSMRRLAWEHIQRVLHEHDGNISAAARVLGMHRRTLQRKLGKKPASR